MNVNCASASVSSGAVANIQALLCPGSHLARWVIDHQQRLVFCNALLKQWLGLTDSALTFDELMLSVCAHDQADALALLSKQDPALSAGVELKFRLDTGVGLSLYWLPDPVMPENAAAERMNWTAGSVVNLSGSRVVQQEKRLFSQLHQLASHLPGFVYQYRVDAQGQASFPFASAKVAEVYGCSAAAIQCDASPVMAVLHPDDRQRIEQSIEFSRQQLSVWHAIYRVQHPDKGLIWVEGEATPERLKDGSVLWHGFLRDVTQKQQALEKLNLLKAVYQSTQGAVMITDAQGSIVDVNQSFVDITGYQKAEVIGRNPAMLASGLQDAAFYQQFWQALHHDGKWRGKIWNRKKSGEVYAELLSVDTMYDVAGEVQHYVGVFSDISSLVEREQELMQQVNLDALTGLPNRRLLTDRLTMALEYAGRHHRNVAVCFVDLDHFKEVNDQLGHATGDKLLQQLAQRLQAVVRPRDTVARTGGDEFVILLTDLGPDFVLQKKLEQLRLAVFCDKFAAQTQHPVSASIGVSLFPLHSKDPVELMDQADQAMYQAKHQGKNQFRLYQPG